MKTYELKIRIVDKGDHPLASKRGDVIVIQEAGDYWGPLDLTDTDYRFVTVDLLDIEVEALLSAPLEGEPTARKRLRIDIDKLPNSTPERAEFLAAVIQ